ncbi:MAG: SDR family NAD(P)-dependent oxidoreductase [Thermogutta sp.]|nr:SDR family NAD(P)-dependent oxidoreductase [Thermogutta sp.]
MTTERFSAFWQDKAVLVTGGSSGLGLAIAQAFADAGSRTAIVGLEPEGVEAAVQTLRRRAQSQDAILGTAADITSDHDVARVADAVRSTFGELDVLVNNAGRSMRGGLLDTTPEQFRRLMELNFIALVRVTRTFLPELIRRRGHIVNIGSLASKAAARFVGAYPATKHAVAAYSQQLRLEFGTQGLHVLLVCPGPVARAGERLYGLEGADHVPDSAKKPGAGVRVRAVSPDALAQRILNACRRRRPEIVIPGKARLLFALCQLWPSLGDRLIRWNTRGG